MLVQAVLFYYYRYLLDLSFPIPLGSKWRIVGTRPCINRRGSKTLVFNNVWSIGSHIKGVLPVSYSHLQDCKYFIFTRP